MNETKVYINVDLQPDFFPGGALGAPGADKIIPKVNKINEKARQEGGEIIFTYEAHPHNMGAHFEKYGRHCLEGTPKAEIDPRIKVSEDHLFVKGTEHDQDYLTSINAKDLDGRTLAEYLLSLGDNVHAIVYGLLLDYCAGDTAVDIAKRGIRTSLIRDLTPALNLKPGDDQRAIDRLVAAGVKVI
ncbi:MAG: Pyrazinamidase/nicotinamidase [Berkelbacteria bacterium GW2011_GWA2_46_7]|uniref:nicotinamidase n=1 Tax=Berkelbacteria bacterium GW2011_GWA2_46_7 TaxID=1618335 RepID=A0A0G1SQJ5_9BACT|nr:MAG: Pyrazinamidase/nicotinamidase [Berkelbacteria bacterium GW2011_GWA2_46_7]